MKIYHNPQCSKSIAALELIQQRGFIPEVVEYLDRHGSHKRRVNHYP